MHLHTSVKTGAERVTLITRLLTSGVFQPKDKNALWLMSVETLRKLADDVRAPENEIDPEDVVPSRNHRHDITFSRDDHSARQMLPPSAGEFIRNRGR